MAGPIENLAPGKSRVTAWAITCAVECRSTWRPSGVAAVMIGDGRSVVQGDTQVGLGAVDDRSDRRLLQAGADRSGQIERRGVVGQFALGAVGERDRDVRHATVRIGAATTVRRAELRATRVSGRRRA